MDDQSFEEFMTNVLGEDTNLQALLEDTVRAAARKLNRSDSYIDRLEKMLDDFEHRTITLRAEASESKVDKKKAERKLKLFIKAACRLDMIDSLEVEMEKVIKEEKDNIRFNTFFGIRSNQLNDYEEHLEEYHDFNE